VGLNCKSIPALLKDPNGWKQESDGVFSKWIWKASETRSDLDAHDGINPKLGHMQMQLLCIKGKARTRWEVHPDHAEVALCWQGNGRGEFVEASANTFYTATVGKFDTIGFAKGAAHSIENTDSMQDLVMVVIHAVKPDGVKTKVFTAPERPAASIPPEKIKDYVRSLWDKDYYSFNNDPNQRAIRKRVWGRTGHYATDRDGKRAGDPDNIKEQFHVTNYCFEEGQENPGHFHPYSIELIINLQGHPLMLVREKLVGTNNKGELEPVEGWPGKDATKSLKLGDTVLVKVAGWHRYINAPGNYKYPPSERNNKNRSLVLAMQAPQPIMHTLECETDF
jgi:quercetin dioxygenase-like cupin family protein